MSIATFDPFSTVLTMALALDADGVIQRASPNWLDALDWTEEDCVGKSLVSLCHPEDRARVEKALGVLVIGVPLTTFEVRVPRPRQAELRFAFRCILQDDTVFAVAEDISNRTRLEATDSKFRSLVDYAAETWVVHNTEGMIVDANQYACESLGYTKEELLNMRVSDFEMTIQPGRLDGVWNRMEVGRPVTVEGRHRRKNGEEFPVEVRLGLFRVHDEVLMLALCRDITKRKEAETKLQQLNERLEAIVEERTSELRDAMGRLNAVFGSIIDGLFAIDRDSTILSANPAMYDMFGVSEGSLIGSHAGALLMPELYRLVRDSVVEEAVLQAEIALPEGRIGQAVACPIFTEEHPEDDEHEAECIGSVVLIRDVTIEREVDRMKTDFIATVSHELRTPLTSVLGFARLTRNKLEKTIFPHLPEDNRKVQRTVGQISNNVDIIVEEGERLTALINDVLDISKMEAARIEWKMEKISPAELITRSIASTAALFTDAKLTMTKEIATELPTIEGDADRLQQVLINLISNAVKFTEEGVVTVAAEAREEGIEFSVTDTGMGIDPSEHEAIFEKFKQVGDTLTNKPQGTGLGLPISKQIVDHHKGRIWVTSKPGEGSRFAFLIPFASESNVPERLDAFVERLRQHVETISTEDLGKKDILVVDDDKSLRELLHQELTEQGFRVRLASDGYEAIGQVRASRPDLIILDVMMPEISGFDVAAMLKNDPETEGIPIIILSIIQDHERGFRLGVDRFLNKPAKPGTLVAEINQLLQRGTSTRKVLVVDREEPTIRSISQLLTTQGYEVVGSCTGPECLEEAKNTQPDMIILGSMFQGHEDTIRSIRFEKGLEHIYVVLLVDESEG